jgi:hypothetical protein
MGMKGWKQSGNEQTARTQKLAPVEVQDACHDAVLSGLPDKAIHLSHMLFIDPIYCNGDPSVT